jgi:hypothetical protein
VEVRIPKIGLVQIRRLEVRVREVGVDQTRLLDLGMTGVGPRGVRVLQVRPEEIREDWRPYRVTDACAW